MARQLGLTKTDQLMVFTYFFVRFWSFQYSSVYSGNLPLEELQIVEITELPINPRTIRSKGRL